jgi:hypothetical protein
MVWVGEGPLRRLGALVPLHAPAWYKNLPLPVLRSFRYGGWPLCTPLVRAGCARTCLQALLDWFADHGEAPMLELSHFPRDGVLYRTLADLLHEREQMALATDRVMCPRLRRESATAVLGSAAPSAALVPRVMGPGDDARRWIGDYLNLGGDPGLGAALGEAHRRERLVMTGLDFGGRPIARSAAVTAGAAAFAFATARDAALASEVMAEAALARRFHDLPALRSLDSLAGGENPLLYRLWGGARLFQSLLIGDGSWGDVAVAVTSAHDDVTLWTTP